VTTFGECRNPRRYYLKRRLSWAALNDTRWMLWEGKQLEQPGRPLPVDFPARADLVAVGYVALEDLAGADTVELHSTTKLRTGAIAAVLAAALAAG